MLEAPNISFIIQIVSFMILFAGLKTLIFDPTVRVIEERERRTSGAKHAAVDLKAESEKHAIEYEATLQKVRLEVGASSEATRVETEREEHALLATARDEANAQLAAQRDRLAIAATSARETLAAEAAQLSSQMFEKVVGRPSV